MQPLSGVQVPVLHMTPCAHRSQSYAVRVFYEASPAGADRLSADSKLINDKLDAMVSDRAGFREVTHDGGNVDADEAALVIAWVVNLDFDWSD